MTAHCWHLPDGLRPAAQPETLSLGAKLAVAEGALKALRELADTPPRGKGNTKAAIRERQLAMIDAALRAMK